MLVKRKINPSAVFGGQLVAIRELEDKIWQVSFMEDDPGFFDEDENRVEPASNPFAPKVLPMSSI
jgi:putative transposase